MQLARITDSPLVEGAREARRLSRWWLAYIFGVVGCIILGGSVGKAIGDALIPHTETSLSAQIAELIVWVATVLTIFAWIRFKEGRPFSSVGFRGAQPLLRFVTGLGIGAGMMTLSVLLLFGLGQYQQIPPLPQSTLGLSALVPVLLLVIMWTIQSSTEEIITRGYFIQVGALQMPGWVALLVPGLIFSGLHFTEVGLSQPVAIVNILLYALFAGLIAVRQGSLWVVCGIHTGWNWFQGNVYGLPVSGNAPKDVTIFLMAPTESANRWLSGGTFGPEGSLVVLVIWAVALGLAYRYFRSES